MSRNGNQAQCRDCGTTIIWMKTYGGKNIPVDPETVADPEDTEIIFDRKVHTAHFDTCGKAAGGEARPVKAGLELPVAVEKALLKYQLCLTTGDPGTGKALSAFVAAAELAWKPPVEDYEDDIPF